MSTFKSYLGIALICIIFLSIFQPANGQQKNKSIKGYVVGIMDGDTYDLLLDDKTKIRIRMHSIDAPEKGMPFSRVSKKFLSNLCFNKTVTIIKTNDDGHGRIVGKTYTSEGKECGEELLKAGLVWHYKKYNSDPKLAQMEIEARRKKTGIWSEPNPLAPWDVRKLHRNGISTIDSFDYSKTER